MADTKGDETHWSDKIEIGYNKGLYVNTSDGSYSLKMRFLIQPQLLSLFAAKESNTHTFVLRRGQMRFFGSFFDPNLKYRVMFELPGTEGGATSNLRDMWVDWQWRKCLQIKAGQFFVFYDHENLEPSWALQFVDRSIINAILGFERDLGVDVHGTLFSDHLEYDFFLMNGDGRNQVNLNSMLMTGGRIVTNLLGKHDYFISDVEESSDPNLAIGIAAIYDMGNASIDDDKLARLTGDIAFRYRGISALALANLANNSVKNRTDYGFLGQMGLFLIPKHFEIAGRWIKIIKNGALGTDTVDPQEAGVSLNYYFNEHPVKLQADYIRLWNNTAIQDINEDQVRIQLQLFF